MIEELLNPPMVKKTVERLLEETRIERGFPENDGPEAKHLADVSAVSADDLEGRKRLAGRWLTKFGQRDARFLARGAVAKVKSWIRSKHRLPRQAAPAYRIGNNDRVLLVTVVLLLPLAGCCHRQVASFEILPVPPKDSRWEGDTLDHIQLPLTAAGRTELETELEYGLSHANKDRDSAVESNAAQTYQACLDLLAVPHTVADLSGDAFKSCFQGALVQQVVDAREPAFSNRHAPVALRGVLSDGKYWWIFYRDATDRVTALMVVKFQALTRFVEQGR